MDVFSLAKKLRINRVLLKAATPFCRRSTLSMTAEEARFVLNEFFPRKEETALCLPPRVWTAPECDVSVIVPTYNNGALIGETVHSALAQKTDCTFEVLVINDGSTDETAAVLADIHDDRLRVIDQENRGVSQARNRGMEEARGEYLYFLDGDDILLPDALEALTACARETSAWMVQGGYALLHEDGTEYQVRPGAKGRLTPGQMNGFVCGKLFRREGLAGIRFPGRVCYEDSIMAQLIAPLLSRQRAETWGISKPVFGYRYNPVGFSQTFRCQPKSVDTVWITDIIRSDRAALSLEDTQEDYEHLIDMAALSCRRTAYTPRVIRRAVFTVYREFVLAAGQGRATRRREQNVLETALRAGNERLFTLAARLG